jgi:hypothetical protein
MSPPAAQSRLLVLSFGPGARLEGELAGALERMALRERAVLRDAMCVARDPHDGTLQAIDLALARRGGGLADLVDFRLAPDRREALTVRTLTARPGGVAPGVVRAIGEALEPGAAVVAVLLAAGADATELLEAAVRCGGRPSADEPLGDHELAGLGERLVGLAAPPAQSTTRGSPP